MKTLLLMRHAKSSWNSEGISDHDRPLNQRGLKTAPSVAKFLIQRELVPELIVASSAVRAQSTAKLIAENLGDSPPEIIEEKSLYLAPPEKYFEAIRLYAGEENIMMAIGHNPGLEQLAFHFSRSEEPFPTAAILWLKVDIGSWSDFDERSPIEFQEVFRPKFDMQ